MVWVYGKRLAHEASLLRFRPLPPPNRPNRMTAALNKLARDVSKLRGRVAELESHHGRK
jgi:hypothetical protein